MQKINDYAYPAGYYCGTLIHKGDESRHTWYTVDNFGNLFPTDNWYFWHTHLHN